MPKKPKHHLIIVKTMLLMLTMTLPLVFLYTFKTINTDTNKK